MHVFGLVAGCTLAMWLFAGPLRQPCLRAAIAWSGVTIYLGLLAVALYLLYGGYTRPPRWLLNTCPVYRVRSARGLLALPPMQHGLCETRAI
jgi:hypothetical protein